MVTYPIHVHGSTYRGRDARKRQKAAEANRIAADLTRIINEMLLKQQEPIRAYDWMEISDASGYSLEVVREFGYSIDCGSNGFTAWRHDLTYDQAMAALDAAARSP